jgi:hypothetical protein
MGRATGELPNVAAAFTSPRDLARLGDWLAEVADLKIDSTKIGIRRLSQRSDGTLIAEIGPGVDRDGNTATWICKYAASKCDSFVERAIDRLCATSLETRCRTEQRFYRELNARLLAGGIPTPHVLAARMVESHTPPIRLSGLCSNFQSLLVLENLATPQRRQYQQFDHLDTPLVQRITHHLARIHARFSADNHRASVPPAAITESGIGVKQMMVDRIYGRCWSRYLVYRRQTPGFRWIAQDPTACDTLQSLSRLPLRRIVGAEGLFKFNTVIHGDCHGGNVFFDNEGDGVRLVDWQRMGLGSPAGELAYFLAYSHNWSAVRDELILRSYYDALIEFGGSKLDYPFEVFEREFQLSTLVLTKWFVVLCSRRKLDAYNTILADRVIPRLAQRASAIYRQGNFDRFGSGRS